jgi:hypothetical protein
MARNYLGTDGYYENGSSYMLKYPIHAVFASRWDGALHFNTSEIVSRKVQVDSVVTKLKQMNSLQSRWATVMIPDRYHRIFGENPPPVSP